MTTDKTPATLPVDVLAVMREIYEAAGKPLTAEQRSALFEKHVSAIEAVTGVIAVLEIYADTYNDHWTRGMPILEPMSDRALARVKGESA